MLACDKLQVVPATVHIPLDDTKYHHYFDFEKCSLMHKCLQTNFGTAIRWQSVG